MIDFPNAKINIGLNVISQRSDGFHNIETIFYPLKLADILEIEKSDRLTFKNTGLKIDTTTDNNLCIKTYHLLRKKYKLPNIAIHLHKIIPFGAGLGGGSSDASYMIRILNKYFDLKIPAEEQRKYASAIGSDCAFFLENKPLFAYEKGNKFQKTKIDLSGYYLVLIYPRIYVNTGAAYRNIHPKAPAFDMQNINSLNIKNWKEFIVNDFEEAVFKSHPEIKKIKHHLYNNGAIYASMSGSGSSVYGIFSSKIDMHKDFPDYFHYSEFL